MFLSSLSSICSVKHVTVTAEIKVHYIFILRYRTDHNTRLKNNKPHNPQQRIQSKGKCRVLLNFSANNEKNTQSLKCQYTTLLISVKLKQLTHTPSGNFLSI